MLAPLGLVPGKANADAAGVETCRRRLAGLLLGTGRRWQPVLLRLDELDGVEALAARGIVAVADAGRSPCFCIGFCVPFSPGRRTVRTSMARSPWFLVYGCGNSTPATRRPARPGRGSGRLPRPHPGHEAKSQSLSAGPGPKRPRPGAPAVVGSWGRGAFLAPTALRPGNATTALRRVPARPSGRFAGAPRSLARRTVRQTGLRSAVVLERQARSTRSLRRKPKIPGWKRHRPAGRFPMPAFCRHLPLRGP